MSLASRRRQRGSTKRRGRPPGRLGSAIDVGLGMVGGRKRPGRFRKGRGRGITASELRGFRKLVRLLGQFGMAPRKMRGARPFKTSRTK